MKLLLSLITTLTRTAKKPRRSIRQSADQYQQEMFKKLLRFGQMPVTFL